MGTDQVIKNISHKLRHYLEVERREEGFVTSLKKHKERKSTKSLSSMVHDRSIRHLFNSQQAHRILAYFEENSPLSDREKEVRSALVQYMTNGEVSSSPTMAKSRIPHRFPTDSYRERKQHVFLGSVPKTEAERLVRIATKLYVTTEMLLNNECCHTKQEKNSATEDEVEEELNRGDREETETVIREFHIPDIRSKRPYREEEEEEGKKEEEEEEERKEEEEADINPVVVNNQIEELPRTDTLPEKSFKDVFCQTENSKEFFEDCREPVEESDRESGVHVFSYSSNATRILAGNTKQMESSSQSTDMSDDSNYCDDTCSDEEGSSISESSELNSIEHTVFGINKLKATGKCSPRQEICEPKSSQKSTLAPPNSAINSLDLSDVECTSSEICSTCNSDTCSCNSCYECQGNNFFIVKNAESEMEEETSESNTCSCSTDECACNEKGIDLEEQNNLDGSSNEVNCNADVNNNTVVTVREENTVVNGELPDEHSVTAECNAEEQKDEDTLERPELTHQLTTESWDSQVVDEETQILSIHEAAKNGDLQVVELLSKVNRKYIETVDERGWTPIHLAAANGHTGIVKFLALEGAHISALDPSGYTALHIAAMKGHKGCMEALLEAEADVESITSDGFTALHLAALNNHISCCKILLAWGASLKKEDALGRTVVDMAEEYSLKRVKKLLHNFNKQLENFNNIVDTMETFSGKKHPKSDKALPTNVLYLLTSVMTDEGSSN